MTERTVRVEVEDGVATWTIDRPQALNALDPNTLQALRDAVDGVSPDVRAIVVTGAGDKAFVAGADIKAMAAMGPLEAERFSVEGHRTLAAFEALPIPTFAAVNGFALGGGCELMLACDVAVAAPHARFGQPEVGLGVIPGLGGTVRLPRRVGPGWARRLLVTGERIDAATAARIGLVTEVVESGSVLDRALELAGAAAKQAPRAVSWAKASCLHAEGSLEGALALEQRLFGLCFATKDQREGMEAFVEKRPAVWSGR
mgnify:FL=1